MYMKTYKIIKRTFEAKKYSIGSIDRQRLEQNAVTSSYMPSYKWTIEGEGFSHSTKTKKDAENFVINRLKGEIIWKQKAITTMKL